MRTRRLPALALVLALFAAVPSAAEGANGEPSAVGGGSFLYNDGVNITPMQFSFGAVLHADGATSGSFHHFYVLDGFTYDFWGTVTCLTFDAVNHRAWVGGVLTKVTSTDPDVNDPEDGLFPGDDAWFRVLDSPDGDRSTAMGFVGVFESSQQYCDEQPWPEGNARTHPVTSGQIKVDAP
jgi:hypothetical protein